MESPNVEQAAGLKRKRSPVMEEGRERSGAPSAGPIGHPGNVAQINYLTRSNTETLRLIEGDSETFGDVLGTIDDYEGVLQRHESLAANLGAKLVGPLLLKSFEKLFDGPIKTHASPFGVDHSTISWLDIVTFARSKPTEFVLAEVTPGFRICRFWIKGIQVEISEDDYRLIMSGGPERMIPTQAIPEDESAELGTLNILETRLAILIKRADAVASKARQLNYHLKGRKASVLAKKAVEQPGAVESESRNFSPQPFSAINVRSSNPPSGEQVKLQQHLLEQFLSQERRQSLPTSRSKTARTTVGELSAIQTLNGAETDRRASHTGSSSLEDEGQYRLLMGTKIEKLNRGDPISPPCDRCRRLKFDCTKHLTACQACTKKHAKCSWKDVREGELDTALSTSGKATETETGPQTLVARIEPGKFGTSAHVVHSYVGQEQYGMRSKSTGSADLENEGMENEHTALSQMARAAAAAGR